MKAIHFWMMVFTLTLAEAALVLDPVGDDDLGSSWQKALKGGIYGVCGVLVLRRLIFSGGMPSISWVKSLISIPLFWSMLVGFMNGNWKVVFVSAGMISVLGFALAFRKEFSTPEDDGPAASVAFEAIVIALFLILVLSMVAYLINHEQFTLVERNTGLARLRGIMGHPNALGRAAASLIGLLFLSPVKPAFTFTRLARYILKFKYVVALGSLAILAFTFSRTSALALLLGIGLTVAITWINSKRSLSMAARSFIFSAGLVTVIFSLILATKTADTDDALSQISRSGDANEITSATGRMDIWLYAIEKIAQNPVVGYGVRGCEDTFKTEYYNRAHFIIPHPHNMYLELAISVGVPGALVFLAGLSLLFFKNLSLASSGRPYAWRLFLLICILIAGLTERSSFGNTTLFYVILCVLIADVVNANPRPNVYDQIAD